MSAIVAIVQARMGSSRLPGKVLMDIAGAPMLWHVVRRARRATTLDRVLVATSTAAADDAVAAWCATAGVECFRGSEPDVLDRYYRAAIWAQAEVVVRLTADCPLLDPAVIDRVVTCFLTGAYDYVSNVAPPTFPDGLDTEVLTCAALWRAWREARQPSQREHVTPYLRQYPERFRLGNVTHCPDLSALRWTVDEPADLAFVRAVYREGQDLGLADVCALLARRPELRQINGSLPRNAGYARSLQEERAL